MHFYVVPLWCILVCKTLQFLVKSYRLRQLFIFFLSRHSKVTKSQYCILSTWRSQIPIFVASKSWFKRYTSKPKANITMSFSAILCLIKTIILINQHSACIKWNFPSIFTLKVSSEDVYESTDKVIFVYIYGRNLWLTWYGLF